MNVAELKELLEDMDDGDEVRIATQPNWPLAFHVAGIAYPEEEVERFRGEHFCEYGYGQCGGLAKLFNDEWHHLNIALDDDHEPVVSDDDEGEGLPAGIVWIVTGDQPDDPYAPRAAWAER